MSNVDRCIDDLRDTVVDLERLASLDERRDAMEDTRTAMEFGVLTEERMRIAVCERMARCRLFCLLVDIAGPRAPLRKIKARKLDSKVRVGNTVAHVKGMVLAEAVRTFLTDPTNAPMVWELQADARDGAMTAEEYLLHHASQRMERNRRS